MALDNMNVDITRLKLMDAKKSGIWTCYTDISTRFVLLVLISYILFVCVYKYHTLGHKHTYGPYMHRQILIHTLIYTNT